MKTIYRLITVAVGLTVAVALTIAWHHAGDAVAVAAPVTATMRIETSGLPVRPGVAVFDMNGPGDTGAIQVGYVRRVDDGIATIVGPHTAANVYTLHIADGSISDTIATMFPTETQSRVQQLVRTWMDEQSGRVGAAMLPVVTRAIRDAVPTVQSELRKSIRRHGDEVDQMGVRLQRDVIDARLIPLAKTEVLPIVRRHATPPASSIGRELWDRVSVWRFGWRAAYDKSPLPKRNLVNREFDRFLENEAMPVLEDHADEIADAVQKTLVDTIRNPNVREQLREAAREVVDDPETRALVQKLLRESLLDNEALRSQLRRSLTSPEALRAYDTAEQSLEPLIRQIGDEIFGTRRDGISPGFARTLRRQILGRDRMWITVVNDPTRSTTPPLRRATQRSDYPVIHLAETHPAKNDSAGRPK